MKIILAYDGSSAADAAAIDLRNAGLPPKGLIDVISVHETPTFESQSAFGIGGNTVRTTRIGPIADMLRGQSFEAYQHLSRATTSIIDTLERALPGWKITGKTLSGPPAQILLASARMRSSDLIVLAPDEFSLVGQLLHVSVSSQIASQANCSVRVVRQTNSEFDEVQKIVVGLPRGFSGRMPLREVVWRSWQPGTQIRIVRMNGKSNDSDREFLTNSVEDLKAAGLKVSVTAVRETRYCLLLEEADAMNASTIFFPANSDMAELMAKTKRTIEIVRQR